MKAWTDKDWTEAKELSRLNTTPNPNAYAINKHYPKARQDK